MKNTSWSESSNLNIPHLLKSTCQFQVFEASVPPTHPLSAQKCSDRSPPQVIIFPDRFYEEEQFLRKASSISCSSKVQLLRLLQTDFTDNCSARLGSMHVCDSLQLGQVYCWLLDTYSRCTLYTVQYVNSRKPHISTTSAILFRPLPQIPILSKLSRRPENIRVYQWWPIREAIRASELGHDYSAGMTVPTILSVWNLKLNGWNFLTFKSPYW